MVPPGQSVEHTALNRVVCSRATGHHDRFEPVEFEPIFRRSSQVRNRSSVIGRRGRSLCRNPTTIGASGLVTGQRVP